MKVLYIIAHFENEFLDSSLKTKKLTLKGRDCDYQKTALKGTGQIKKAPSNLEGVTAP